jgi:hypothetical protein
MKKVLLVLWLLVFYNGFSQVKRENLFKEKIGSVNLEYTKSIDLQSNTQNYYVFLMFQNQKYIQITDTKIISFYDQEKFNEFIKDLKSAYQQMLLKEKVEISWTKADYSLILYDFSKALYLESKKGVSGYTTLNLKQVENLIQSLSKIEIGKDVLLKTD